MQVAAEFDDLPGPVRDMLVRLQKDWLDALVNAARAAISEGHFAHDVDAELRELNRQDEEDPMGKIVYLVNLNPLVSTSKLSEEMLLADSENIDSVEWDQKESRTYIYR